MAHYVPDIPEVEPKRKHKIKLPHIEGRFGLAFSLITKEVFLGVTFSDVITEKVTRKRVIKTPKGTAKVYRFDEF